MDISIPEIKQAVAEIWTEMQAIRYHLHQHPEPSFKEFNTARFIAEKLIAWGVFPETAVAGTGLIVRIEGRNPSSKTVALRADMDALPIQEWNEVPYKSLNDGFMHACGHDVHTTCLLGAVKILHQCRSRFDGTIKAIFQPGEELLPGGASLMIEAGVLSNPPVNVIFGQHVFPDLPVGKVGFRKGQYMASCDEIYITIKGIGGHGAMPHRCVDPILISAHLIIALQQVVSRNINPIIPAVLSIGKIESAGGATNVIPEQVTLKGTFRTVDESERFAAHEKIKKMAFAIVEGMGGELDFRLEVGYPALCNDEKLTSKATAAAIEFLGAENVVELPIRMTAEDFSYYSQLIPSCFYRLGTSSPDGKFSHPVHSPHFDIDMKALETGIGLFTWIALKELCRSSE
jgi:amidohydrolase